LSQSAILLGTGNRVLAEMTSKDSNWGTGVDVGREGAADPSKWRGTNILGWALMVARAQIRKDEAAQLKTPTPSCTPGLHPASLHPAAESDSPTSARRDPVQRVALSGGILDRWVLERVDAVAQQCNCIGCDAAGLAKELPKVLPYGCSYGGRRPMPDRPQFAVQADRAKPGTIDVRHPPVGSPTGRPLVLNLFAQWEKGKAGQYNRVQPSPKEDAASRERWFKQCLLAIDQIEPRPTSIAFPYGIGCRLAGGDWSHYETMLVGFALANPGIEVFICSWGAVPGYTPPDIRDATQCSHDGQLAHTIAPAATATRSEGHLDSGGEGGDQDVALSYRARSSRSRAGRMGKQRSFQRLQGSMYS
jgi:hypothetical protein